MKQDWQSPSTWLPPWPHHMWVSLCRDRFYHTCFFCRCLSMSIFSKPDPGGEGDTKSPPLINLISESLKNRNLSPQLQCHHHTKELRSVSIPCKILRCFTRPGFPICVLRLGSPNATHLLSHPSPLAQPSPASCHILPLTDCRSQVSCLESARSLK